MLLIHRKTVAPVFLLALLMANGCATLPQGFEKTASQAFTDAANTSPGKDLREEKLTHAGQSGFVLQGNGLDAFVARAPLTHFTPRGIDAQYYRCMAISPAAKCRS